MSNRKTDDFSSKPPARDPTELSVASSQAARLVPPDISRQIRSHPPYEYQETEEDAAKAEATLDFAAADPEDPHALDEEEAAVAPPPTNAAAPTTTAGLAAAAAGHDPVPPPAAAQPGAHRVPGSGGFQDQDDQSYYTTRTRPLELEAELVEDRTVAPPPPPDNNVVIPLAEPTPEPPPGWHITRRNGYVLAAFIALLIIIAVVVPVLVSGNDDSPPSPTAVEAPTVPPVEAPTAPPTEGSTPPPTPAPTPPPPTPASPGGGINGQPSPPLASIMPSLRPVTSPPMVTDPTPLPSNQPTRLPTPVPTPVPTPTPLSGVWVQQGADLVGESNGDFFGISVALSNDGNIVAVGGDRNDGDDTTNSNRGHVQVFQYNGTDWNQLGSELNGEAEGDGFGGSVSISDDGSILAVGAIGRDDNGSVSGQVQVFQYNGTDWSQLGSDLNGEAAGDQFGESVSLSADGFTLAVGAYRKNTRRGQARVLQYDGNDWNQLGSDLNGEANGDWFGNSVSLSADGSTLAVGADGDDGDDTTDSNRGQVRVFQFNGTDWKQLGSDLNAWDLNENSQFGLSVSLSENGSILAGGAPGADFGSGVVRVFHYKGNDWIPLGSDIKAEVENDLLGESVSLSLDGTVLAMGAEWNDGSGERSGHVRVFQLVNGDWEQLGDDIDGKGIDDKIGVSVALSGDGKTVAGGAFAGLKEGIRPGYASVYRLDES